MKRFLIVSSFCFFLIPFSFASAHQPYLVGSEKQVTVVEPEISKAYYGEFSGSSVSFTLHENKPFKFYVGILVPDQIGVPTDVSAEIRKGYERMAFLSATSTKWSRFYEPFGGDNYYEGPEFRSNALPGTYTITISRPGNSGKYVLAIGETESFTTNETIHTLKALPVLKSEFFGKSMWTAYFNRIGLYFTIGFVGIFIVLMLVFLSFKKFFSLFRKK
ncbi:MAG: hypothetical protein NTZ13_00690 [Candidatus Parcubacteria bacterium]|nr:hypothetical protein [Candidatus Parcubacteria bacterium]